jgi:hypothetical protein
MATKSRARTKAYGGSHPGIRPETLRLVLPKQVVLPRREVMLYSDEQGTYVRARLDEGYPELEGGYGGWEDEPRPGQVSATVFRGTQAPQLTLRLILGGYPVQPEWADCERDVRALDAMGRQPVNARRGDRPPLLKIRGQVPHRHREWFIEDVEWGDFDVVRGVRMRAFVTVTLRMFVPVTLLRISDPKPAGRRSRWYVVRRDQSLDDIARDELKVRGSRAVAEAKRHIRQLNRRIRDKVRKGDRIRLPVGRW